MMLARSLSAICHVKRRAFTAEENHLHEEEEEEEEATAAAEEGEEEAVGIAGAMNNAARAHSIEEIYEEPFQRANAESSSQRLYSADVSKSSGSIRTGRR